MGIRNNDWLFEYHEEAMTYGGCLRGVARLGKNATKFCVAGDISAIMFLLVDQTPTGLELVRALEQWFGRSTLLYKFDCGGVKGYFAEWYFNADNEALNHRIGELRQGKISSDIPPGRVTFLHSNSNYVM